jgi:FixJ family two-component response regulator
MIPEAIASALRQDRDRLDDEGENRRNKKRFEALSNREREVLVAVVEGLLNKQIAHRLKLSEVTVKAHRRRVMIKLGAKSIASLVQMTPGPTTPLDAMNDSDMGGDE